MKLLKALTLAQLQIFNHMLMEMEAQGVPTLALARGIVALETGKRHARRQRVKDNHGQQQKTIICPDCGANMHGYARKDLDGSMVVIEKCDVCQLSRMVE